MTFHAVWHYTFFPKLYAKSVPTYCLCIVNLVEESCILIESWTSPRKSDLTYYQFHCHTSGWYLAAPAGGGYDSTTCSQQSYLLGRRQKVIAFTYFKPRAVAGGGLNSRKYVEGILGNLEAIVLIYGPEWTMRLYHNLGENDIEELLPFTAREKQFVLCDINRNPLLGKISWS